ncbi:MAG: hypothetical protein JRN42_06045 [Nitrososphaerota archaeon]|nr:hypothetical protein [Nitrososphaerota archaeon]
MTSLRGSRSGPSRTRTRLRTSQERLLLRGYSPDPSTFTLTEVLAESGAPYDILPFRDTYADGQCPQ